MKALCDKTIEDCNKKIERYKATSIIEKELARPACKISSAQKEWAIDYLLQHGEKAFSDYLNSAPTIYTNISNMGDDKKTLNVSKNIESFSDEEMSFALKLCDNDKDKAIKLIKESRKTN